jgi:hypothetical protein
MIQKQLNLPDEPSSTIRESFSFWGKILSLLGLSGLIQTFNETKETVLALQKRGISVEGTIVSITKKPGSTVDFPAYIVLVRYPIRDGNVVTHALMGNLYTGKIQIRYLEEKPNEPFWEPQNSRQKAA